MLYEEREAEEKGGFAFNECLVLFKLASDVAICGPRLEMTGSSRQLGRQYNIGTHGAIDAAVHSPHGFGCAWFIDVIRLTRNAQKSGSIATFKTIDTRQMRKVGIHCQCCKRLVLPFLGLAYANTAVAVRALLNKQSTCSISFVQRQRIQNPRARQEGNRS